MAGDIRLTLGIYPLLRSDDFLVLFPDSGVGFGTVLIRSNECNSWLHIYIADQHEVWQWSTASGTPGALEGKY